MSVSRAHARRFSREWRDRHRAKDECTSCGKRPSFKRKVRGVTHVYSKCIGCLRRNAWFQAECRERQKEQV